MIRLSLFLLFLAVLSPPCQTWAEESPEVRAFLAKRQLVGQIPFAGNSALLDASGQREIARLIPSLQQANPEQVVIRIEGFARGAGNEPDNIRISMQRAQAVADYLAQRLDSVFYVTGCGSRYCDQNSPTTAPRADIVLYDNSLQLDTAPVEQIIKRISNREG
jgi:outer membrane protein OmpA-like peptidoglycan-associated protein